MSEFIQEQVDELLSSHDSHLVPFYNEGAPLFREGYADRATEAMHDIDDSEAILLQIVQACLSDKPELAKKLAEQYRTPLYEVAETMIKAAIERSNEELKENAA